MYNVNVMNDDIVVYLMEREEEEDEMKFESMVVVEYIAVIV